MLLLDKNIKDQQTIYVHPLDNSASLPMTPSELETFIKSTASNDRDVIYVDFELQVKIDKDNPPDLKFIADAAVPVVQEEKEPQGVQQHPAPTKSKSSSKKPSSSSQSKSTAPRIDSHELTEKIIDKIITGLGIDVAGESNQINDTMRRLKADIAMELNILRNASYSAGYSSARSTMVAQLEGQLA